VIKNKKILITGINGFLGTNLAQKLKTDNEIIGISQSKTQEFENIRVIEGDVSNEKVFDKIDLELDLIFHFGSPTSIILFKQDPEKYFNNTVSGMTNILNFAKNNSIDKLIYPSSGSVYGNNPLPHSEGIIPQPANQYGAAKIKCEHLAEEYFDDIDSTGLRIFAAYGPGEEKKQNLSSVVNLFLQDIKRNESPTIFGDGSQTRDFMYIDDVISAIILSSEISNQKIINVGSGISTSFNKIIETINTKINKKIIPRYIKKEFAYIENLKADTNLMKSILKIEPISIESGIEKFAKYLNLIN